MHETPNVLLHAVIRGRRKEAPANQIPSQECVGVAISAAGGGASLRHELVSREYQTVLDFIQSELVTMEI